MKKSYSSEANRFSASQQIPRLVWNPKVHYRIHKFRPPVPIPNHIDPVHTPTSYILTIHFNIILPSTPGSPSVLFPSVFPTKALYTSFLSPIPATRPDRLIFLDFIARKILGEQYRSFCSSLSSFLYSPVTSSLLDPNILLSTLFSNTLSLDSSLNVSDQVSHPYKSYLE